MLILKPPLNIPVGTLSLFKAIMEIELLFIKRCCAGKNAYPIVLKVYNYLSSKGFIIKIKDTKPNSVKDLLKNNNIPLWKAKQKSHISILNNITMCDNIAKDDKLKEFCEKIIKIIKIKKEEELATTSKISQ